MKHILFIGILLLTCSCEELIESSKITYQFSEELKTKFPDESIGVFHKHSNGHITFDIDKVKYYSEELHPETILVIFKDSSLDLNEDFINDELISPIIESSKSIFGNQVKHGQLRISKQKNLQGFSITDYKIIEFDIEF